jgi:uncharacterized membrane protein YdjX (TVP38/TMEM64 family)
MSKARRALFLQLAGLLLAVALFFVISRFLPVVDLIAGVQQRVMHWGAWSAVCYPLLFALCNVLLLPGGIFSVGGGSVFAV